MSAFRRIFLLLMLAGLLLGGCKESSTNNTDPDNTPKKSVKRGIAYNLTQAKDLDTLKNYLSWWYNWAYTTGAPAGYYEKYNMEFVPMLWGKPSTYDMQSVKNFIIAHPEIKYLLVLNEPNLTDQANLTPASAVAEWAKYESVVLDLEKTGRTIYLVGPQMNYGTMTGYSDPVVWLDAFYKEFQTLFRRDPRIDYLAFHWYDYGLSGQLDRLKKYGKKIWITEMANWNPQINSYTKQMAQMKEMVNICETRDDVFRYAWFIGRGSGIDNKYTNLFNAGAGELSELGKYYISLPYNNK